MDGATINRILEISESFELPDKLLNVLLSDSATKTFDKFMEVGEPLDHDWFTAYFEEQHANKTKMAQDFTPPAVCDLLSKLVGEAYTVADICSGTGGLTISAWKHNPEAQFLCLELSNRAIPLLLFNLAIRNITAKVIRMDILTGEMFEAYEVESREKYSTIRYTMDHTLWQVDAVISNPPYSLKYKPTEDESRFGEFAGMIPTNYADYGFMAVGLNILRPNGRMGYILPHGVLFRGNKEAKIRTELIKRGYIKTVIGLPDKLFINTAIPTCIIVLEKNNGDGVLFVDASKQGRKERKNNVMDAEHVAKIYETAKERKAVEKFAAFASLSDLEANDYNLNIPRYVNTFEAPPIPDLDDVARQLLKNNMQLKDTLADLYDMLGLIKAKEQEDQECINRFREQLRQEYDIYTTEKAYCDLIFGGGLNEYTDEEPQLENE